MFSVWIKKGSIHRNKKIEYFFITLFNFHIATNISSVNEKRKKKIAQCVYEIFYFD